MCVGVPGRIVEVDGLEHGLAVVEVRGRRQRVNVGLLDHDGGAPEPDDWVLVHMGFAMDRLDPDEAADLEGFLSDLGEGLMGPSGPASAD